MPSTMLPVGEMSIQKKQRSLSLRSLHPSKWENINKQCTCLSELYNMGMEILYSWEKGIRRVGLQVAVLKVDLTGRETEEQRFE